MKKSQLHELFRPNEMPTLWGSIAKPLLPNKIRFIYAIGFIVLLVAGLIQNNLTVTNIYEIQGHLGLTMEQGAFLQALYYMGNAWTSMVLFKIRQHIGVNKFIVYVIILLLISHIVVVFDDSFLSFSIFRLINGFVGSGLTVLCVYFALQMLPNNKKYLLFPIAMGLLQTGAPIVHYFTPYLMLNENANLPIYFEFGLTLFVAVVLLLIELPPSEARKAIYKHDILPIVLYAIACAIACLSLTIAPVIWWDHSWLAISFISSLVLFLLLFLIEFNRKYPIFNYSFISTFNLLKIAFAGGFIRLSLTEQSIGMSSFFNHVEHYTNYQLMDYYGVIVLGAISGAVFSIVLANYNKTKMLFPGSFLLVAIGSFLAANISSTILPNQVYLSQFLIAAAGIIFVAPIFIDGIVGSLSRGNTYILTFVAVFTFSQALFGLLGASLVSYFIKVKTVQYSQDIINRLGDINNLSVSEVANVVNTEAATLAYGDLFTLVGIIACVLFVFLILEMAYYKATHKIPLGREFTIFIKRIQNKEIKTQKMLRENK